jgi:hypothetical protein
MSLILSPGRYYGPQRLPRNGSSLVMDSHRASPQKEEYWRIRAGNTCQEVSLRRRSRWAFLSYAYIHNRKLWGVMCQLAAFVLFCTSCRAANLGEEAKKFIRTVPLSSNCSPYLSPWRSQDFGSDASTTSWMASISTQERKDPPSSKKRKKTLDEIISNSLCCLLTSPWSRYSYRHWRNSKLLLQWVHASSSSLDETFMDIHTTGICYNLKVSLVWVGGVVQSRMRTGSYSKRAAV